MAELGKDGVHRGKIEGGRFNLLDEVLEQFGLECDYEVVGSLASGVNRGSRHCDLDVRMRSPRGMSKSRLRKIEDEVISKTGIDFYFHDE